MQPGRLGPGLELGIVLLVEATGLGVPSVTGHQKIVLDLQAGGLGALEGSYPAVPVHPLDCVLEVQLYPAGWWLNRRWSYSGVPPTAGASHVQTCARG